MVDHIIYILSRLDKKSIKAAIYSINNDDKRLQYTGTVASNHEAIFLKKHKKYQKLSL